MSGIPLSPRTGIGLKRRTAGGDTLEIYSAHFIPVIRIHCANLVIHAALLASVVRAAPLSQGETGLLLAQSYLRATATSRLACWS